MEYIEEARADHCQAKIVLATITMNEWAKDHQIRKNVDGTTRKVGGARSGVARRRSHKVCAEVSVSLTP